MNKCLECGRPIPKGHRKFCSAGCAYVYHASRIKPDPNHRCEQCNKPLERHVAILNGKCVVESETDFKRRRFCNSTCASTFFYAQKLMRKVEEKKAQARAIKEERYIEMVRKYSENFDCPWELGRQKNDILYNPFI